MTVTVHVLEVNIPAMSTIGFAKGIDEDGNEVEFAGDHRPMRDIGEAVIRHLEDPENFEPPACEVDEYQFL